MTAPRINSPGTHRGGTDQRASARVSPPRAGISPLAKKLGIGRGSQMAFVDAPCEFERAIEPLPEGAYCPHDSSIALDIVVLFAGTRVDLSTLCRLWSARLASKGVLWVAWPKHASKLPTDLSLEAVQKTGQEAGLVAGTTFAIDQLWAAVRFTRTR